VQQTAHPRVAFSYYCFKKGMQVLDPRERHRRTRICSLLWVLAKGRSEAIKLGEEIRKEVPVIIE